MNELGFTFHRGAVMRSQKLLSPHEAEIDRLLQIMAVLIDKLGGEVILNREEIESFFDIPVVTRVISSDYIRLRVAYPDESDAEMTSIDIPLPPEETT